MWKDEIVEELHAMREARAAQFGFDSQKIFDDIKAHEAVSRAQGFKFVSFPPRRPEGWIAPAAAAAMPQVL